RRAVQAAAQVGIAHLILDHAKGDPRIAADDQDLADRVAWYAMGAGHAAHRPRTSEGQSANARNNRGGPALLVHVANLIFGRDLAGADHLDAVPGNPVGRFAAEPFDTQPLVQAGSPVDRAGRAQVGELVGSP